MNNIYLFGELYNGLEFVTYIIIPISILLVILVYFYFNLRYLKLSFDFDIHFLNELEKSYKKKKSEVNKTLSKYQEDYILESEKEKL